MLRGSFFLFLCVIGQLLSQNFNLLLGQPVILATVKEKFCFTFLFLGLLETSVLENKVQKDLLY